ncbi:MAG TPA: hypothetical protein VG711_13030, partial [Phycisphaerales bacterium]|nr:hypothetical protein [Phycisphaerales bacterium]
LVQPDAAQTLFEPADAVAVDESLWLEVKIVSQFTTEGPNASYSSQLLSGISQDLTKLASDPQILHAAFLVIMFVASDEIASHDLRIWEERCLTKGLPLAAPSKRSLPITNRLGNALLHAALFPVPHF